MADVVLCSILFRIGSVKQTRQYLEHRPKVRATANKGRGLMLVCSSCTRQLLHVSSFFDNFTRADCACAAERILQ